MASKEKMYLIDKYVSDTGLKISKIAELLNFDRGTWYRKKKNPDTFTRGELVALAKILKKEVNEIMVALDKEI